MKACSILLFVFLILPIAGNQDLSDLSVQELLQAAQTAIRANQPNQAIAVLQRVVTLRPNHPQAWTVLGFAYLSINRLTQAETALRKQIELDPHHEFAYFYLAQVAMKRFRADEAESLLKKQIEEAPLSVESHAMLGNLYLDSGRFQEAAAILDTAVRLRPGNADVMMSFGKALYRSGQQVEGREEMEKAYELTGSPVYRYLAAEAFAESGSDLETARNYAESACAAFAATLNATDMAHLRDDIAYPLVHLTRCWTVVGKVYAKTDQKAKAESYLKASWTLVQQGRPGRALADFYRDSGRRQEAARIYAAADVAEKPLAETADDLQMLVKTDRAAYDAKYHAQMTLQNARTVNFTAHVKKYSSAEYQVLIGNDGKILEFKRMSGDESLDQMIPILNRKLPTPLVPPDWPVKIPRRGLMSCSSYGGQCTFVFVPLPDAPSVSVAMMKE